jgi:methylmalonyl-CoA/ethylmalonyl-CoA epimerase
MITGMHHINFVVRDLEHAVARYVRLLGVPPPPLEELPARGVRLARFRVGQTWLVLLQPVADGAPARHLAAHGEGCFLLSFEVDDLDCALEEAEARGAKSESAPRLGLDGWRVADVDTDPASGIVIQLCEDRSSRAD